MATPPRVSIAIPAYNEAPRLPHFLARLGSELESVTAAEVELVVVDDGSRPDERDAHRVATETLGRELKKKPHGHRAVFVEAEKNGGKASAIRLGWARARSDADWLGFLDADGAVPAHEVVRLLSLLPKADFEALAGSRIRMAGRYIVRSEFRHWQGRIFATLTELMLRLGLYDPQCGYKLFKADLLRPLLPRLREQTWLLDVEVLSLISRGGGRLREEPIDWAETGESKVRFGIDAARMARDLAALKARLDREGPGGD